KPLAYQNVSLTININEDGSGIENVTLYISLDGGVEWNQILMANLNSTSYETNLPGQPAGSTIKYYFIIYDNAGNSIRNPTTGFYSLSFTLQPTQEKLIPLWVFWLVIGIIAGIFVVSILIYRSKKVVTPPLPPPKPPKLHPPAESEEMTIAPEKSPPPKKKLESQKLRKFDQYVKQAEDAISKNYLHLAYTKLIQAAEIALEVKDEKVAQKLKSRAKKIKEKMDSTSSNE
ncbi:MAG: hypothetical protein ACFFD2_09000, partial [Promethearchaeota archaeon]